MLTSILMEYSKSRNVLGIAPVAIIDRQLPFEYTIASRSTDVIVWNAVYDAHNEVSCLTLGSMTPELQIQFENSSTCEMLQEHKSMFEKQARVERFNLIQTFHACKQEEGKPVGPYVIKMKNYVAQLERLGYVLPQDLSVGLIINGLTSDFVGFIRNYNKHNMGKTIGELHALLIEYEKGLLKKAVTPQVMVIQGGRIRKANKKSLNAKGKEHPVQDDTCHHCKEVGHCKRNYPAYLAELIKEEEASWHCQFFRYLQVRKLKQVEAIGSFDLVLPNGLTLKALRSYLEDEYISQEFKDYLKACGIVQQLTPPYTPQHNGVSKKKNRTLLNMVRLMMNLTTLSLSFWDYALESAARILNMVPTKKDDKTPYELWYGKVPNLSYLMVRGCEALVKRDTPDKLQQRFVKCIFIGYPKKMTGYYFYFPPENKIVVARYAEFLEKNHISQKVSGRFEELEEIQDEDTSPSKNTSEIPMEVEGFEPPQEEGFPNTRDVGDLIEPTNYKAALLDPKSDKWLDAMNVGMQSMKDNQVWCLVDLHPNSITAFYDYEICHPRKVCKLQRSIYGLKKASRSWNKRFDEKIKRNPEAKLRVDCYCNAGFETDKYETKS
ncbi:retrotransposon protein, putative, ty1-copia subclass [Tanacetum coccineum]|uniref:Retrotransposon protein, putative, ty1-copia subclass n=1 Tax=Tanacetum coccineum TaxID=301880 RepID=A0ABQ5A848_9ASTR